MNTTIHNIDPSMQTLEVQLNFQIMNIKQSQEILHP